MKKMIPLLLIACLFITGCWDITEPERLGVVMAVGLDLAEKDGIKLTCAEINIRAVAGGGLTGGGNEPPFHVHSGTGATIFDAIRKLSMEAAYRLFFAHTQVIVLSEELARSRGVKPIFDFFERNEEFRRSTWLLVAKKGQLENVLAANMPIKTSKGQFLAGIIDYQNRHSYFAASRLGDFIEQFTEPGNEAYTAGVTITSVTPPQTPASFGEGQLPKTADTLVLDTAVFKEDKMAGWFNSLESRGLLWVEGEARGGILTTTLDDKKLSLEILDASSEVKPEIKNGNILMNIKVKVNSNIGESLADLDFSKKEVIKKIEQLQAREIKKEIGMALKKSRELETDVFGFGRYLHAKYPEYWKQKEKDWYALYPEIEVNIEVDSTISRIGLITKPARREYGGK